MRIKTFLVSAASIIPSFAVYVNQLDWDKKSLSQIETKHSLHNSFFTQTNCQSQMSNAAPIVYKTPPPAEMPKGSKMPGAKTIKGIVSSSKLKAGTAKRANSKAADTPKATNGEQKLPAEKSKGAKIPQAIARQSTAFIKKTKGQVSSERLKLSTKKADGLSKLPAEKIKVAKKLAVIPKSAKMPPGIPKGIKVPAGMPKGIKVPAGMPKGAKMPTGVPNVKMPAPGTSKVSSAAKNLPSTPSVPKVPKI